MPIKPIVINRIVHILLFCTCLLGWQWVHGQVRFSAEASRNAIPYPETFQVQYTVEGTKNIRNFKLPVFNDFKVVEDFEGMNNVITMNGQTTQVVETYSKVVILSPRRTGRFLIPAAEAVINGKKMRTNTVNVVVQKAVAITPGLGFSHEDYVDVNEGSRLLAGQSPEEKIRKNFFVRAEVNKKSCYVGEPLEVVYKTYMRLDADYQVVKRPSLNGFSVIEMVDAYDNLQQKEMYNGMLYYVNVLRKVQLIPLQEGEFVLDPAEVEGVVHFSKKEEGTAGIWSIVDHPVTIRSEPVPISVKALPLAGQPPVFTNAVGQFTLAVNTPPPPVRQGDLVKIQVVISGTGNLPLITAPIVSWPKGVDTADPAVKEEVNQYIYPLSGSKTFEYSFTAPDTGDCVIPAINFYYFDPQQKAYKTATSQPDTMHIAPGPSKAEMEARNAVLVKDNETGIPRHLYFFAGIVLLIAGWIIYQSLQLKKARKKSKEAAIRAATPIVPEPKESTPDELLNTAREALQRTDKRLFCHEVQQVLWKTVADKCQVPPSTLNKNNITGVLMAKGVPGDTVKNLLSVLNECEWALYAPDQQVDDMKRIFYEARSIVLQLQQV